MGRDCMWIYARFIELILQLNFMTLIASARSLERAVLLENLARVLLRGLRHARVCENTISPKH
jgi:hypothetical protein